MRGAFWVGVRKRLDFLWLKYNNFAVPLILTYANLGGIIEKYMKNLEELTKRIIAFRNARDWEQFHNPKDVALSLVLEAAEVMEHFQWKSKEEIEKYVVDSKLDIAEELADVLYWVLLMSNDLNIDVLDSLEKKISKNEEKYPVEKAKGRHTKYTKL